MLNTETWDFWIIVWVLEFAVLTHFVLKNDLIKIDSKKLAPIGLLIVVFASFFFLFFNVALFSTDEFATICMLSHFDNYFANNEKFLGNNTDENKLRSELWNCYHDTSEIKWNYFKISITMAILVVFGSVFQELGHRTKNSQQPNDKKTSKSAV